MEASASMNWTCCTAIVPMCRSPSAIQTSARTSFPPRAPGQVCSTSAPRDPKCFSGLRSKVVLRRVGFRRELDAIVGGGCPVPLARGERLGARRIGGGGSRAADILDDDADRAGAPLTHTGDQVGESQRLTLLPRQRFFVGIADEIAFADRQCRARRSEAIGRIAGETKHPGRAGDLHDTVKSLGFEFRQKLAKDLETASIERYLTVWNWLEPRSSRPARLRRRRGQRRARRQGSRQILDRRRHFLTRALQFRVCCCLRRELDAGLCQLFTALRPQDRACDRNHRDYCKERSGPRPRLALRRSNRRWRRLLRR